jgi:hypothetical protein
VARNRAEFLMRRETVGSPLRDARGALGRAVELRASLLDERPGSLAAAQARGMRADEAQPPLWS